MQSTKESNKSLYEFLDRQLGMFKGYFLVTRASLDKESIHQMRVTVKRINTFYKLKKHINFPITLQEELFDIIKHVYGASGRLRDLHIQKSLLGRYRKRMNSDLGKLKSYLAKTEKALQKELNRITADIDLSGLEDAAPDGHKPEHLPDIASLEMESVNFIKKKHAKISKMLLMLNNEDHVHDLRKQIKQLYFVLQFLRDYFPDSKFGDNNLKPLRRITDRLGGWNDLTMFAGRINEFNREHPNLTEEERAVYYLLQKMIEADKQDLLENIDATIYLALTSLNAVIEG